MNASTIFSAAEHGLRVEARADIHDLLGAAYHADGLLLLEGDLGPEVFRLGSGLAGELFQTLTNHRLPTAVVIEAPAVHGDGDRFADLAREHAVHGLIRFFTAEDGAKAWLQGVTQP